MRSGFFSKSAGRALGTGVPHASEGPRCPCEPGPVPSAPRDIPPPWGTGHGAVPRAGRTPLFPAERSETAFGFFGRRQLLPQSRTGAGAAVRGLFPPPPSPVPGLRGGSGVCSLNCSTSLYVSLSFCVRTPLPLLSYGGGGKRQHKPGLPPPAPGRRRRGPGWAAPGEPPAGTDTPLNPLPGSQRGRARLPPTRPGGGGKRNGGGPASAGPGGEGSAVRSLCGKGRSEDEVLKPRSILL